MGRIPDKYKVVLVFSIAVVMKSSVFRDMALYPRR
jgi:hypothetical protein